MIVSDNVDYANIKLTGNFYGPYLSKYSIFLSNEPVNFSGIFKSTAYRSSWGATMKGAARETPCDLIIDTSLQPSYHSNERESRPKTKFFSLLIYAGYPMQ